MTTISVVKKIVANGNSYGITISPTELEALGVQRGDIVRVTIEKLQEKKFSI